MASDDESRRPSGPPRRSPTPPKTVLPTFDVTPSARFVVEALAGAQVEAATIGRIALWAWLPDPADHPFTKDLDLAVARGDLPRLREWLAARGVATRELTIGGVNVALPSERVNVDFIDRTAAEWGDLGALYEDAVRTAGRRDQTLDVAGHRLLLAPLEHLVAMKLAAGGRKDEDDVRRVLSAAAAGPDAAPEAGSVALDVASVRGLVARHLGPGSIGRLEDLLREAGHPAARRRARYQPAGGGAA